MKVKELINELQNIKHQDKEILLSGDPEGNDFRTIDMVDILTRLEPFKETYIIYPTDEIIEI